MRLPIFVKIMSIVFVVLCSSATADGFRPGTDLATSFVNEITATEIAVFPTIIRTPYISRYSTASQKIAMKALKQQISQFRECVVRSKVMPAVVVHVGVLLDFESNLPTGTDPYDTPVGFSTFSDNKSTAKISTTATHPSLPGEATGNSVLQLDLDVTGWGGVLHRIENAALNRWVTHDWSAADGFSFWLYGNNTGTQLFFDVLDNRISCSIIDDAERYRFVFYDDVAGWRLMTVPFKDLGRKDVGNGAPDDGLGLVNVHGWGFGTLKTGGPKTYYIDDLQLWSGSSDVTTADGETILHGVFDEVRLTDTSSRLIVDPDISKKLVVEKAMDLMCKCARLTADRGFNYFKMDERAHLADGRATFRITFFRSPPEGIPVVDVLRPPAPANLTNPMTAVFDAEGLVKFCNLLRGQLNQP
jgi:hypothetical protein